MATIQKTAIGTSDPIDLCKGLALFPFGSARAGITTGKNEATLLSMQPQILAWRLGVNAGYGVFAGMCGPAYAILFEAEGHTTNNIVELTITEDQVEAGFLFGFGLKASAGLTLQKDLPRWVWDGWHSHFADHWETVFNVNVSFIFDLINLILTFINALLKEEGKTDTLLQSVGKFTPSLLTGAWGLFDQKSSQFASGHGTWKLTPAFQLPINIVPLTADLPPPTDALFLADKALQAFLGYLRLGPVLGVSVPVTITMTEIIVDEGTYGNLSFSGGTVTGHGPAAAAAAQKVGVTLQHQPGLAFSVGDFFAIGVLKFFNFSASQTFQLSETLGINIKLGTYHNTLSSSNGGRPETVVGHDEAAGPAPLEVVLEPAGARE